MATTSIGDTTGGPVADLAQPLSSGPARGITLAHGTTDTPLTLATETHATDVSSALLAEISTSDLSKLTSILNPVPDPGNIKVLDSLLNLAAQEVARGNDERAVGYLADYATRDPRLAEALPLQPALEPVRDQIDSMVSRMAMVAKMSAESSLSRAEQAASEIPGKLSNWDTNADVLVKLAHQLYEAGGYANYSRTTELAKLVTNAGIAATPAQARSNEQLLATASLAAASSAVANPMSQGMAQMVPGLNVPYWASPDFQTRGYGSAGTLTAPRRATGGKLTGLRQNLRDLKPILTAAARQVWFRSPLLVILLVWFSVGLAGGVIYAVGTRIWPEGTLVQIGNLAFALWGLGFLAMVGFGFYARIRYRARR